MPLKYIVYKNKQNTWNEKKKVTFYISFVLHFQNMPALLTHALIFSYTSTNVTSIELAYRSYPRSVE